jgi:DNA invertase Pin-like site-specific DNA recombinase
MKVKTEAGRAWGYIRVSKDRQVESGLGLEAQRAAIDETAKKLGLEVAHVYADEGLAGDLPLAERPGLLDCVAAVKRGDVLIVARRDRLGRDVVNVALVEREVMKRGAKVVSAAGEGSELEGPSGALVRTILDACNVHEKAVLALRTRAALQAKKARGERAGNVPFGFKATRRGKLVIEHDEQKVIATARRLRARGNSFRDVVEKLRAKGVVGRTGKPLCLRQVFNLLRNAG